MLDIIENQKSKETPLFAEIQKFRMKFNNEIELLKIEANSQLLSRLAKFKKVLNNDSDAQKIQKKNPITEITQQPVTQTVDEFFFETPKKTIEPPVTQKNLNKTLIFAFSNSSNTQPYTSKNYHSKTSFFKSFRTNLVL